MKLLCSIQDESLRQHIAEEAARQNWEVVLLADPVAASDVLVTAHHDLVFIETSSATDNQFWSVLKRSVGSVHLIHPEISESFIVDSLSAGVEAAWPSSTFSTKLFSEAVQAHIRRRGKAVPRVTRRFKIGLDFELQRATVRGQNLDLTITEFRILRDLVFKEGQVVPRETILKQVFGTAPVRTRSLDVHVCALRKKLKKHGLDVESIRRVGYRLRSCPS